MKTLDESQQKTRLSIDEVTFAIPAQSFVISCAISAEEALPVVTEFALRIIYVCGSMSPDQLRGFFGFTEKETAAVLKALLDERLVQWHEDRLELTSYAVARFLDSSDNLPRFFKIQDWSAEVVFDLISFNPVERTSRLKRSRSMVELIPEQDKTSKTIQWAEKSFQENFRRICKKDRAEIYKITDVDAGEKFMIPLPCEFHLNFDTRMEIRRAFDDESFGDRLEVAQSISDATSNQDQRDNDHFESFVEIFNDDLLRGFISKETFDLRGYVKNVYLDGVTSYKNSKVGPILGSLHLDRNQKILLDSIKTWKEPDAEESAESLISSACWLAPRARLWARSNSVRELVKKIDRELIRDDELPEDKKKVGGVKVLLPVGYGNGNGLFYTYRDTFPTLYGSTVELLGGNIEIFLLPGCFVCALFHFHLDHPVSVPIGFISSDPVHIEAATDLIQRRIIERHSVSSLQGDSMQSADDIQKQFKFVTQSRNDATTLGP